MRNPAPAAWPRSTSPGPDSIVLLTDGGASQAFLASHVDFFKDLKPLASLFDIPDADHSFHVPIRSGRTEDQVLDAVLDQSTSWMRALAMGGSVG